MIASRAQILLLVLVALAVCLQAVAGNLETKLSSARSLARAKATKMPTLFAPTKSPVTSKPSKAPTTSRPTKSPTTTRPTRSPTPPTSRPTKSPTTSKPSKAPTTPRPSRSPTTSRPTKSPVLLACETWKGPVPCERSLNMCQWTTRTACPTPTTPIEKCPTLTYGCRSAKTPFCAYGGTAKQKQYQCQADVNCLWNAKKLSCGVNAAAGFTVAPTNEPTTMAPTTGSPTSKSPTSKVPTPVPTFKPTTGKPTKFVATSSPTSARPTATSKPTKRGATARPTPTAGTASCYNGCWTASNGVCEDTLAGSVDVPFPCYPGSDCADCGPRPELEM